MRMRRRASTSFAYRWMVLLLGLSLVFAACGSDDTPAPADPGEPAPADPGDDAEEAAPAPAADQRIILGHPGHLRPIWSSLVFYIAEEFGFWEKYGATVIIRPLRSGGDVTQATHTGEIDGGLTAAAPAIGAMARGANVRGVMGMDQVDWILVTADPEVQSTADLVGKQSGAMAPGDSRYLILEQILNLEGVDISDVDTIDLTGDHTGPLVAGVVDTHVIHVDELAEIRHLSDREWRVLAVQSEVMNVHYAPWVANAQSLETKPDAWVATLAGLIDTIRFMHDPANHDEIVDFLMRVVEQTDRDLVMGVYKEYIDFNWWQLDEPGIDRDVLEGTIQTQFDSGQIETLVEYDEYFTTAYWEQALELVESMG